jgi:hypothetical protein
VLHGQQAKAAAQALLRLIGDRNDASGLPLASARKRHPDARAMLIMPRRFDQHPPDQCVAGTRDATAPMLLAAGVLARHEPEIRYQCARRVEAPKVVQLGQNKHGRQRVDPPEAPQPADLLSIRLRLGDFGHPLIQFLQADLELINRQQIIVHDSAFGRMCPLQTGDPAPMPLRPVPTGGVVQAAAQEQLAQPMPHRCNFPRIILGETQIADRFILGRRRVHLSEKARQQQLDQLPCIARVRLDPLARLAWNERWRDHLAAHAPPPKSTVAPRFLVRPGRDQLGNHELASRSQSPQIDWQK